MANESLIFDILARDGASPSLKKVGDAALEASGSLKDLSSKLKDVNGRTAAARVKLDGDKEAQHELDVTDVKLARLGKIVANPKIGLDGVARARADISGLDLALDRLGAKHATASVGVSGGGRGGIFGKLAGLFGGGGGAGGSAASGGGSFLTNPITLTLGALLGGGLVPGAAGLGIGGAVGGGAVMGGLFGAAQGKKVLTTDLANIKQVTTALKTAVGTQKTLLSASLVAANKQYAKDSAFYAPFTAFQKSLSGLMQVVIKPLRGIMGPLSQIFTQFGKGLTTLGPMMTQMFKASLPFIRQFLTVMLQAGKTLMPAFTQAMNQMVKSGALKQMTQALVVLVQGLAGFVVALGPGMKPSAQLFLQIAEGIKGLLIGLGVTFAWIARIIEFVPSGAAARLRHALFATFNGIRHETAVIFDGVRHDIAHVWDMIWNNTIGREQRGIADVVKWFKSLPGRVIGALSGLGHQLYGFAHSALTEFLNGLKAVAGSIFSWVGHFVSTIWNKVKKFFGLNSPSALFFDAGKNLMLGLAGGIKAHAWKAAHAAQQAAAGLNAFGGDSGARTHSAGVAQAYARSLLSQYGWSSSQMSSLVPLWNQESGWNAYAVNASSGAYGIPQSLGHGHPYNLGDYKNQIIWGLNYIRGRYGSPAAAEQHELAYGWYDKGGWLPPGLTLAMNATGKPERILPPGGGGTHVVLEVRARPGANSLERALVEIVQKFVIVSGGGDVQAALGQKA